MTVDQTQRVARVARRIQAKGLTPVAVVGLSPQERANLTLWRSVRSSVAALVLVVSPVLLTFLGRGDFGRDALVTLATSLAVAVVTLAFQWAQKYGEAKRDDEYAEQLDGNETA